MKKIIIFIFSMLFISQVNALNIDLQENQTFFQGAGIKDLTTINISIDNDNEITKEKSFSIVLPDDANVRFSSDLGNISTSGVGAIKIATGVTIMSNLRVIKFNVLEDFKKGDSFIITGIKIIVYTRPQGGRSVLIDTTGDQVGDFQTANNIRVDSTYTYSDQLGPNEVLNFTGTIIDNKVVLSADMPGDLDFQGVQIDNQDVSGKVLSGVFRFDMNNFTYDLQTGVEFIKIRTIDTRANYSSGLLFNVNDLKPMVQEIATGSVETNNNTGVIDNSTGTIESTGTIDEVEIIDTPIVEEIYMIDKYLPTFKIATFNTFMLKFDNIIDKKPYKEEVRIARNDIIKLLKLYDDKKITITKFKSELKKYIELFVIAYKK